MVDTVSSAQRVQLVDPATNLPYAAGGASATGTAGSPSPTVTSVQGVSGGTPVPTTSSPATTATTSQVPANVAAVTLLVANTARLGATVYYDGAAILYLLEGAGTPSATNYTYKLGAGYYTAYEAPAGLVGAIKGIWSAAVGSANVTERTA